MQKIRNMNELRTIFKKRKYVNFIIKNIHSLMEFLKTMNGCQFLHFTCKKHIYMVELALKNVLLHPFSLSLVSFYNLVLVDSTD